MDEELITLEQLRTLLPASVVEATLYPDLWRLGFASATSTGMQAVRVLLAVLAVFLPTVTALRGRWGELGPSLGVAAVLLMGLGLTWLWGRDPPVVVFDSKARELSLTKRSALAAKDQPQLEPLSVACVAVRPYVLHAPNSRTSWSYIPVVVDVSGKIIDVGKPVRHEVALITAGNFGDLLEAPVFVEGSERADLEVTRRDGGRFEAAYRDPVTGEAR